MGCKWILVLLVMKLVCLGEGCWDEERIALLQLKSFFNYYISRYNLHKFYNWVENSDCCKWDVVHCDDITRKVIKLHLDGARHGDMEEPQYLNASLFSSFQQLQWLDLSGNNIGGCIENEGFERLSGLKNLENLELGVNKFNNSILPSLIGLSSLKYLNLAGNNLKGIINIQGLNNLEILDLSNNNLSNKILSSVASLSSLKSLRLFNIGLKGSVDVEGLYSLKNLEELRMGFDKIDQFANSKDFKGLKKLNTIKLHHMESNDATHLFHSTLMLFPSLKKLYLRENNFNQTVIIQELQNLTGLEELILDGSNLHVSFLQIATTLTSLKYLSMVSCEFNGFSHDQGPIDFKNLESLSMDHATINNSFSKIFKPITSLKTLSLSYCGLSDTLYDQGLCEMVHLQELHIDNNDLHGALPPCLANLTSLQQLNISSNQIIGNISASPLKDLASIEALDISNNLFQILFSLNSFFNLSNLKDFVSENNQLYIETMSYSMTPKFQLNLVRLSGSGNVGNFPEFLYHQHDLQEVYLSHIKMIGNFPYWLLYNNTQLETLCLVNDSLSGSFLLPFEANMSLTTLDVSFNFFHGQIPTDIGAKLLSLISLNMSRNDFNGGIPSSLGDMKSLAILDLSNNKLSGVISEQLAMGYFSLEVLSLSNNDLHGHIFPNKSNMTILSWLNLGGNHFSGTIPESFLNCSYLVGLYLNDNYLSGKIPRWFGNLSYLVDIELSNNQLQGPLPKELCQYSFLEILDLSENNISGSLPSCFGPSSMAQLHLSRNRLQGQLKDAFYINSSSLVLIDLSYNRLEGNIPSWIGKLSSLGYLILSNNNLEGELNTQLCNLRELRLIDLSKNNLHSKIPTCLDFTALHEGNGNDETLTSSFEEIIIHGGLERLQKGSEESIQFTTKSISHSYQARMLTFMHGIDLSCNKLFGEIPHQIGNLTRIHTLNLSHNNLTGSIPKSFSNLKQIESLDLSYNSLNGNIPSELVELYFLSVFSVAYNNLSGKTPERIKQFATFEESSYEGNKFLCGLPLNRSCSPWESPSLPSKPPSSNKGHDSDFVDMDIFYISFMVTYIVVLLTIATVLYINPYWRRTWFYLIEIWMLSCYYFVIDHFTKLCC